MKSINVINNLQKEYQKAVNMWVSNEDPLNSEIPNIKIVDRVVIRDRTAFLVSSTVRDSILSIGRVSAASLF